MADEYINRLNKQREHESQTILFDLLGKHVKTNEDKKAIEQCKELLKYTNSKTPLQENIDKVVNRWTFYQDPTKDIPEVVSELQTLQIEEYNQLKIMELIKTDARNQARHSHPPPTASTGF